MERNLLALLIAACLVFSACSRGPHEVGRTGLVIGVLVEPESLDPLLDAGEVSATIGPILFSYLLTENEQGRLVPDVATRVPSMANGGISRDGRTIIYHLRRDVTWQDGQPLTAADVVYTYEAIENPKINVPSRSSYDTIATVRAPDPYTVVVKLRKPDSPILSNFMAPDQNYPILPRHILAAEPDINHGTFNTAPVGSGPYQLARWIHGDSLRFTSNPHYFRGAPRIASIVLKVVPNVQTLIDELLTGEISVAFISSASLPPQYARMQGLVETRTDGGGVALLMFNLRSPVIRDVRVRRAISEAVDFPRVVREATAGMQSYVHAGRGLYGWGYDAAISPPRYDPRDARRLLDAAGWRLGPDGKRRKDGVLLTFGYAYETDLTYSASVGLLMQSQLRRIGIDMTLRSYPVQIFIAPAAEGGPLNAGAFAATLLDGILPSDPGLDWFFNCDQIPPKGFNFMRFCDARTDAADAASIATYNRTARMRDSIIVQRRVAAELPAIPLWEHVNVAIYPPALHGVAPSPIMPLWNIGSWYLQ